MPPTSRAAIRSRTSNAAVRGSCDLEGLRMSNSNKRRAVLFAPLLLVSCESAQVPIASGYGPDPALPEPNPSLIPTIDIAPAVGWQAGEQPTPASGLAVNAFASGLDHP